MIKMLLMNVLLALAWVALTGDFKMSNFAFGFVLSFIIMYINTRDITSKRYFNRIPKLLRFIVYFLAMLVKANIQVAYDVITPLHYMRPGIVAVPLDAQTDIEITILANVITLTPGSFCIDISEDKKTMYVHVMNLKDRNKFINTVKKGYERRLLDFLR